MQAIKDQFNKCKYIFMQNRIFLPILITLLCGAIAISFNFGKTISHLDRKVEHLKNSYFLLEDIKISVDSLLRKD